MEAACHTDADTAKAAATDTDTDTFTAADRTAPRQQTIIMLIRGVDTGETADGIWKMRPETGDRRRELESWSCSSSRRPPQNLQINPNGRRQQKQQQQHEQKKQQQLAAKQKQQQITLIVCLVCDENAVVDHDDEVVDDNLAGCAFQCIPCMQQTLEAAGLKLCRSQRQEYTRGYSI